MALRDLLRAGARREFLETLALAAAVAAMSGALFGATAFVVAVVLF